MGKKSIVTKAKTGSVSLRVTIPEDVASELHLSAGDVLDWEVLSKTQAKVRRME